MKRKYNKQIREWIKAFVKEEMRHGYTRKTAEKRAEEVIHNLSIAST